MNESCENKTTFVCRYGTCQFEVIPFGLRNAGATFQRKMYKIVPNIDYVNCCDEDIAMHSPTSTEHLEHLENVLKVFREN